MRRVFWKYCGSYSIFLIGVGGFAADAEFESPPRELAPVEDKSAARGLASLLNGLYFVAYSNDLDLRVAGSTPAGAWLRSSVGRAAYIATSACGGANLIREGNHTPSAEQNSYSKGK